MQKTWGEMTPEEKGALLLAHHEGKPIQIYRELDEAWENIKFLNWTECYAYRVKPEPKRETAETWWSYDCGFALTPAGEDYRIIFDVIDGEPVCDSIRMEELE